MIFSIEISVIILILRLIISSKSVNDDTLKINTKLINNRIIEMSTTNESLTFRNRLIRKTTKFKFICFFEITSMKNELLSKLSIRKISTFIAQSKKYAIDFVDEIISRINKDLIDRKIEIVIVVTIRNNFLDKSRIKR